MSCSSPDDNDDDDDDDDEQKDLTVFFVDCSFAAFFRFLNAFFAF
jgi:hypothetical protein